jgi:hypothetical protein
MTPHDEPYEMFYGDGPLEQNRPIYNNDGVTRMNSAGQATIQIMDGDGRVDKSNAKWGLTYNNDEYGNGGVDGIVESNKNGENHVYKIQIPNDELYKIFSAPPQRGTLDNRLRKDFSMTRRRPKTHNHNHNHVQFAEPSFETIFEPGYQGDVDEREELEQLLKLMRPIKPRSSRPSRRRRIRINYSSEPMRSSSSDRQSDQSDQSSDRHPLRAYRHMGRRQTNKFMRKPLSRISSKRKSKSKSKRKSSSVRRSSSGSNLPLTEINA